MNRQICTALVILGLVLQPFALARSATSAEQKQDVSADMSVMVGPSATEPSVMVMADSDSSMPCHELAPADMDDCADCCEPGCAMPAHCTSFGSMSFAVLQPRYMPFEPNLTQSMASSAPHTLLRRPSVIFHPPILS